MDFKHIDKAISMKRLQRRLRQEKIIQVIMRATTFCVAGCLCMIIGIILYKGIPFLSWEMITQTPQGGFYIGKSGGILNAILGSLYLAGASTILATIFGIPIAIYINLYIRSASFLAKLVRSLFDILFGIPSIIYGAVAFTIMIWLGMRASLLGGILTVTLLTTPIVVRTIDELLSTIPDDLKQVTTALGTTKLELAWVLLKYIKKGLFTAILLAFGRAIGDVAGVLLTTGFSDNIPKYLDEPVATLPLAIFFQLGSPIPEVQGRAYASALILTFIILLIVLCTHILTSKIRKRKA